MAPVQSLPVFDGKRCHFRSGPTPEVGDSVRRLGIPVDLAERVLPAPPEITLLDVRLCPLHVPEGCRAETAWVWEAGRLRNLCAVCGGADPVLAEVGSRLAAVVALADRVSRIPDGFGRHELLDQLRREVTSLAEWHADRVTVAALEAE